MTNPTEEWLKEYSKDSSRYVNKRHFNKFLKWLKGSAIDIVKEYKTTKDRDAFRKKWGKIIVLYYNHLIKEGKAINTARTATTAVRAFFTSQTDRVKIGRGKIGKQQMAFGEHEFKLEQLQKMYRTANIKEKAVLTLGVCLGFNATDFIHLKRDFLEGIMAQSETEEAPIGFWYQRGKTKEPTRCHLTVEAMQALKDYWATLPEKSEFAFPSNGSHISDDAINYTVQTLVQKANIPTMGKIRWHLLRKFLFSALTNTMDEMNAKLCVGKSIDKSVLTYLKNKSDILKKQYSEAEQYFVLGGYTNHEYNRMDMMEEKIQTYDKALQDFLTTFTQYIKKELTTEQAIQKTETIISTVQGRELSDKEVIEEQLGYTLTEEQFKRIQNTEKYLGKKLTIQNINSLLNKDKQTK